MFSNIFSKLKSFWVMYLKFESNGCIYDVEIFHCGNKDIVRFYEKKNE